MYTDLDCSISFNIMYKRTYVSISLEASREAYLCFEFSCWDQVMSKTRIWKILNHKKTTMSIPFFRDRYRLFVTKLIIITRSAQVYWVEIDRYFSCRWANQLFEFDVKLDISNTISRFALKMVKAHLRSCVKKTYTHFVVLSSLIPFVYWFVFFFLLSFHVCRCFRWCTTAGGLWWNWFAKFMLVWVQHEKPKP